MSMYFIFHTKFAFHYAYQHFCNTYHAFHIYFLNKYFIYAKCDNSCVLSSPKGVVALFRGYMQHGGNCEVCWVFLS